jgi:hypothetical protein
VKTLFRGNGDACSRMRERARKGTAMMVTSVVGERRFAVLAGLVGGAAHALPPLGMELSLRKGREGVIETDGPLTVHLSLEDRTDSLVMRFGRLDAPSGSGTSGA